MPFIRSPQLRWRGVAAAVLLSCTLLPVAGASAGEAGACLDCHKAAVLRAVSKERVVEVLKDSNKPYHKRFAKLKAEEIEALREELAAMEEPSGR